MQQKAADLLKIGDVVWSGRRNHSADGEVIEHRVRQ